MDKTILIVDDEPTLCQTLERVLNRAGYRTFSAGSGMEGLVLMQDNKVDLVITDVRMPGISGLDLIRQAHDLDPRVPVIVISGYGDFETAVESAERGAFFFLNKPFDSETILKVIEKGMRLPQMSRGSGAVPRQTLHTISFTLPPDMEMVKGAVAQVSDAVRAMGYEARYYNTIVPFTFDELLTIAVESASSGGPETLIEANAKISPDQIEMAFRAPEGTYDTGELYSQIEYTDLSDPRGMGIFMIRRYCDEISYYENGAAARAVIKRKTGA